MPALLSILFLFFPASAHAAASKEELYRRVACFAGVAEEAAHPSREFTEEEAALRHKLTTGWLSHPTDRQARVAGVIEAYGSLIREAEAEIRRGSIENKLGKIAYFITERTRLQENMTSLAHEATYTDVRAALLKPYSRTDSPPLFPPVEKPDVMNARLAQRYRELAAARNMPYELFLLEKLPNGSTRNTGHTLSAEEFASFPPKSPRADTSFVVFPGETLSYGESHIPLGGGAAMACAGDISISPEEVVLNLKSGNYKIPDTLAAFRAAIQAVLKAGIFPKRFVLRDVDSGDRLDTQKTLITIYPPYGPEEHSHREPELIF